MFSAHTELHNHTSPRKVNGNKLKIDREHFGIKFIAISLPQAIIKTNFNACGRRSSLYVVEFRMEKKIEGGEY